MLNFINKSCYSAVLFFFICIGLPPRSTRTDTRFPYTTLIRALLPVFGPGVGEVTIPGVVPRLTATPGRVASHGPALGEANEEIYRDLLGLDEAEIAELRDKGVI